MKILAAESKHGRNSLRDDECSAPQKNNRRNKNCRRKNRKTSPMSAREGEFKMRKTAEVMHMCLSHIKTTFEY